MKTGFLACSLLALLLSPVVRAAPNCAPGYQQINSNNSIILLGGTAKGPLKQFVVGEFGKDVNQQQRMLGEFDRCGVLQRADIRFDKKEGNIQIALVQNIEHVKDGWLSSYELTVTELDSGKPEVVNNKQGTTHYRIDRHGMIVSSADTFTLNGSNGFSQTTLQFDSQSRLIRSTSRGSDPSTNGVQTYHWNKKNQLVASESEHQKMTWDYDKAGRELRMNSRSDNPTSSLTSEDECQLWDDRGNCTLCYTREMEVFPGGIIRRNITAAYHYEYHD